MCDVNTRLAHRQMNNFYCASGEAVSDWSEACGNVSSGTWRAVMIHHVHSEAWNEHCHHPDNNKGWDTLIIFDNIFYLISSDNFVITFLSCISRLATTWCPCSAPSQRKKNHCERIVLFMQYPLISVQKWENEYVHIYTKFW